MQEQQCFQFKILFVTVLFHQKNTFYIPFWEQIYQHKSQKHIDNTGKQLRLDNPTA